MRKTVLIVEDDAALRTRCRKFLEWERFEVLVAEHENAAFCILEENRLARHAIQHRRVRDLMAVAAQAIGSDSIQYNQKDVLLQ